MKPPIPDPRKTQPFDFGKATRFLLRNFWWIGPAAFLAGRTHQQLYMAGWLPFPPPVPPAPF